MILAATELGTVPEGSHSKQLMCRWGIRLSFHGARKWGKWKVIVFTRWFSLTLNATIFSDRLSRIWLFRCMTKSVPPTPTAVERKENDSGWREEGSCWSSTRSTAYSNERMNKRDHSKVMRGHKEKRDVVQGTWKAYRNVSSYDSNNGQSSRLHPYISREALDVPQGALWQLESDEEIHFLSQVEAIQSLGHFWLAFCLGGAVSSRIDCTVAFRILWKQCSFSFFGEPEERVPKGWLLFGFDCFRVWFTNGTIRALQDLTVFKFCGAPRYFVDLLLLHDRDRESVHVELRIHQIVLRILWAHT